MLRYVKNVKKIGDGLIMEVKNNVGLLNGRIQ